MTFPMRILQKGLFVNILSATASHEADRTRILNSIAFPSAPLEELSATPPRDRMFWKPKMRKAFQGVLKFGETWILVEDFGRSSDCKVLVFFLYRKPSKGKHLVWYLVQPLASFVPQIR